MKHTKRIAALLLALALCFSCAACSKTVGSYRVVKTLGTEQFRIGFRDGDQAAVYVNAALKVLAADGTIHSLALKWFGTDNTTFDSDANALDALGDIPQRTFIMGLNEERFPMSYADGDGYSGFDVELAQAVCARLGYFESPRTMSCSSFSRYGAVSVIFCFFLFLLSLLSVWSSTMPPQAQSTLPLESST